MRIAFLDDSPTARQIVARILKAAGHEALTFETWDELHDAIEAEPPALVLLDVQMPHISGAPIGFVLKRTHPGLPVVYYSDQDEHMLQRLTRETGVDGYICKGNDAEEFLRELAPYLPADEQEQD